MAAACPQEPIPLGWKVWRGAAPPEPIVQAAIDVRDHVLSYARGTIARTLTYGGQTVALFVSSHTWTYRNGVLVTGICIPGVSVLVPVPASSHGQGGAIADSLATPDPTAAVYGGAPPGSGPDWPLVAECGVALAVVVAAFWAALHFAGRPGRRG